MDELIDELAQALDAIDKTTNGWETKAIRAERSQRLAELKEWGKVLGIS